ncbi:MAG TPA: hypothetical protein VLT33_43515 [Labilithrix sp.]|nr:hypothetical protein [Labilithrix sp.]
MQESGHVAGAAVEQEAGTWSQVQRVGQVHAAPEPSPLDAPLWLVHVEGDHVVGPVSATQVAQGIRAGHLPSGASIQAAGEVFWTGVLDEPAVIAALRSI